MSDVYKSVGTISARDFLKLLMKQDAGFNEDQTEKFISFMVRTGTIPGEFTVNCQKDEAGRVRYLLEGKT